MQQKEKSANTDLADQVLKSQIELFKSGDLSKMISEVIPMLNDPNDDRPILTWSLRNRILAVNQGSQDCRTKEAWARVGRKILTWKTVRILKPRAFKRFHKENDCYGFISKVGKSYRCQTCNASFENLELPIKEGRIFSQISGYGIQPEFDIGNTYGRELKTYKPKKVVYQSDPRKMSYGYVYEDNNQMFLSTENSKTFYHELTHKIDQIVNLGGKLKGGQDPKQEIVAELTASVLQKLYKEGDQSVYSFQYIESYAKEQKKTIDQAINQILPRVDKILKYIMEEAQKLQVIEVKN